MATPQPSHKGRVQINGTNLYIQKMSIQCDSEWIDITTFEDWNATNSAMFRKRLAGIRQATFQIEGYYDTDNPPITVGQDGATLTNLYYYPNVRDFPNRFFTLAYATVDNVTVGSQMPGANYCSISVRGMSQGAFTYPSAAA